MRVSYRKIITYGDFVDYYEYENFPYIGRRKKKGTKSIFGDSGFSVHGDVTEQQIQQRKAWKQVNAKRATLAFKRIVLSNLGGPVKPVFLTLTYSKNITDIGMAKQDFNAFAKRVSSYFGKSTRYLCITEFQKRGAIHLHTLFWGIPTKVVNEERRTRFLAKLWSKGYVDIVQTNGDPKISTYMAKYFAKSFIDERLNGRKSYICSRNILRPIVDTNAMLLPYIQGGLVGYADLSTAEVLQDKFYMSKWLGRANYKKFKLN